MDNKLICLSQNTGIVFERFELKENNRYKLVFGIRICFNPPFFKSILLLHRAHLSLDLKWCSVQFLPQKHVFSTWDQRISYVTKHMTAWDSQIKNFFLGILPKINISSWFVSLFHEIKIPTAITQKKKTCSKKFVVDTHYQR